MDTKQKAAELLARIQTSRAERQQLEADRAEMIRIAEERQARGAGVISATPQEGLVLDPRDGTYKNRAALVDNYEPTMADAMVGGGMQGVSLGWGDEILGAGDDFRREYTRARLEEQQREHPIAYGGSEIVGNVVTALPTATAATGTTLLGTMGRGGIIGGIEGMIYGAGQGENREERLSGARDYGLLGMGIGAAAPAAVAAAGTGIDAVLGALGLRNKGRALGAIGETLARSGRSVDDIADDVARAAQQGQPEYRLMDALGQAGQRRASGIVRAGGDSSQEIAEFLAARQSDQADRVAAMAGEAFGVSGTSANQTRAALDAARKAANDPLYDAARAAAQPVNLNNAIDTIDALMKRNPILGDSALANSEIGSRLGSIRNRLTAGGEQLIDFDSVLNVKEDLGRVIGRIKTSGETVPMELSRVYGALDDALEQASDAYRIANDTAAAGRRVVAAVDTGADMASPSQRAIDTTQAFSAMTPEEQAAARVGYGSRVIGQIEANAAPTSNKARPFNSTKGRAEAAVMANDPDTFAAQIARENAMWETQNRALGGSRTADNMEDIADLGEMATLGRAGADALSLNLAGAARGAWDYLSPRLAGQNEGTRALIAKALMSSDPRAALEGVVKSRQVNTAFRRIVEALLRSGVREPGMDALQAVAPR